MPILGALHLLMAIGFALHAHKTGRPQFWLYILLFVPVVGSFAYVLFELLPEMAQTRRGRQVAQDLRTVIDPDRDFRALSSKVNEQDTVAAKCAFAEECERKGMWREAIAMYKSAAQGVYADEPDVLKGLARAELGSGDAAAAEATLNKLRTAHPAYQNQDAHLTFARALEAQARTREAADEYKELIGYYVGLEARTRYGLLLQQLGEPAGARKMFEEVVRASDASGIVLSADDKDWARVARRNLT